MAEKITIAELDIDQSALLKATQESLKKINELKEAQKDLDKTTEEGRKQYVKNAADLKNLNKSYNDNVKALSELNKETQNAETRQELLNAVLGKEVKTITEAREQTKILTKLRNETNATTEEGAALITQLNSQLDRNTDFVKDNADGYLKLKLNIGNYAEGMREALSEINPFNGGLSGFIARAQSAGGVSNLLSNSLKVVTSSMLGITRATLAFLATPLGAVLGIIAGAFLAVKVAMDRSEEATNKLKVAFGAVSGIVNKLLSFLEPLGSLLIDGIVAGFEAVGAAADALIDSLSGILSFLGFESAAKSVSDFKDEMNEAAEAGRRLAKAEADLTAAQRKSQLIQLEYQKTAEKLRQTRDDESLSVRERIAANEQLGEVLREQLQEELKIANLALEVANLRIEAEGKTKETLDEQAEALTRIADIQERITGQESEQLTNRNSLLREAADKAKEQAEALVRSLEIANESYKEQNRLTAQTLEERLAIEQRAADNELNILQTKLENKLIKEEEFNLEVLKINNRLQELRNEANEKELAQIQEFDNRKKEIENNIRLLREEEDQAREELKLEQDFEKQVAELERLQLNEEQKTELLIQLEEQRGLMLQQIRDKFGAESIKALQETFKKETATIQAAGQAKLQIERQVAGALVGILGDSLAARLAGIAIDAAIQVANVKATTAASAAANLAQATATAPPPLNVPFISAAIAQNAVLEGNSAAQISRIITTAALSGVTSTIGSIKFRKGGIAEIQGASHEQGGVPIYAGTQYVGEAEGGEGIGILNRAAFSDFMGYNNSFNSGQSSNGKFQGGGIITQAVGNQAGGENMAEQIAEAIQKLNVVVAVEDINSGQANYAQVVNGADIG